MEGFLWLEIDLSESTLMADHQKEINKIPLEYTKLQFDLRY